MQGKLKEYFDKSAAFGGDIAEHVSTTCTDVMQWVRCVGVSAMNGVAFTAYNFPNIRS